MFKQIVFVLIVCALVYSQVTPPLCSNENQTCGGVRQVKCCLGHQLRCKYHTPIHPGADGDCIKVCSGEGERCGGFTLDPQVCCSGFKCVYPEETQDVPGHCRNTTQA